MKTIVEIRFRHNVEFGSTSLDWLDNEIAADCTLDPPINIHADDPDYDNIVIGHVGIFTLEGATMQAMCEALLRLTPERFLDELLT
jgi:hypothetical protein